ncbi:hypothetical protein PTKIN_Ptkin05aG0002900 [Pterospermum kingtungense]
MTLSPCNLQVLRPSCKTQEPTHFSSQTFWSSTNWIRWGCEFILPTTYDIRKNGVNVENVENDGATYEKKASELNKGKKWERQRKTQTVVVGNKIKNTKRKKYRNQNGKKRGGKRESQTQRPNFFSFLIGLDLAGNGNGNGLLNPQLTATKAEICVTAAVSILTHIISCLHAGFLIILVTCLATKLSYLCLHSIIFAKINVLNASLVLAV